MYTSPARGINQRKQGRKGKDSVTCAVLLPVYMRQCVDDLLQQTKRQSSKEHVLRYCLEKEMCFVLSGRGIVMCVHAGLAMSAEGKLSRELEKLGFLLVRVHWFILIERTEGDVRSYCTEAECMQQECKCSSLCAKTMLDCSS